MGKKSRAKKTRPRTVPINLETREALEQQLEPFRAKFGRDPGPDDPVFFDPTAETPKPMPEDSITSFLTDALVKTGIDPAYIYAFKKVGVLRTEANENLMLEEDKEAWDQAIAEYEQMTRKKQ